MRRLRLAITVGYLIIIAATAGWAIVASRRPYAPFSVLPAPQPITVTLVYSTELQSWLTQAATAFEESTTLRGAPISIVLQGRDSGAAKDALRDGGLQCTAWIPSSMLWIDLLNQESVQRGGVSPLSTVAADAARATARSPLVVAIWTDRAGVLNQGGQSIWRRIHDLAAAKDGWASLGHPEWADFKWGQTAPATSNSGLTALLLMAYDFHGTRTGLTAAQAGAGEFRSWLQPISDSTTYGDASGTLINDMIAYGPSRFDAIATYESLLLEYLPNAARRGEQITALYPPANSVSDHPYAILQGTNITTDQRDAARAFRDFLLSAAEQQQAVQFGLRPVRSDVPINGQDSPFVRNAAAGVRQDLPTLVESPKVDAAQMLIATWGQNTPQ